MTSFTSPMTMSRSATVSIRPPRSALVLMRRPRSRSGLLISKRLAKIWLAPPEISLPITTPPCPAFIVQSWISTCSTGLLRRRPSALRPDFSAIQSSPVSNRQCSISTRRQDSGSQPSELGPCDTTLTWRINTSSDNTGFITQNGEFCKVRPSTSTLLH